MAATVSHLPAFLSLFSQRNLFLVDPQHQSTLRFTAQQRRPEPRHFTLQASSIKKKTSRKVKSNAELCNELRQFLTAVGLPECHVPSLKELSQHGRDDLANIVRRRGYKLIRELLADSSKKDTIGKADNGFAGIQDAIDDRKKIVTGQDQQVNDSVEDFSSSSEISVLETNSGSLISHPDPSRDDSGCLTVESSADLYNLEGHSEKVDNVNGSGSVPTEDICQDGKVNSMTDENSSSAVVSGLEDHSSSNLESSHNSDYHYPPLESPPNLSLEEKVANFMQNGDLDAVEVTENNAEEIKGRFGNTEEVQLRTPTSGHSKNVLDGRDATTALNQRTSTSTMAVDPSLSRDDGTPAEGLSSLYDKDLDVKTNERDYELDVSHLKFMLHQKEIELSQLKEQIKKEQLALSNLQTKAEMAISKAQRLVSEKDAELLAAEESLSGLVEVEIQYEGDGEIVEVTGSFNGWHHQIKMDLESSSSIIEPLRKPKLWSTMLWLYPGTYEIKFIVDGQWKIDPRRESVTRGTICNNILRVDR